MQVRYIFFHALSVTCLLAASAAAQTTINPDISLIGDFRISAHDDLQRSAEKGKLQLELHELEIAATGYLNPFARADIFIGFHGPEGPVEIEEAYLTLLRGLPLNLQIKAGQYLADFGKLNTQHPHQWSWIQRPLMHTEIFGEDGLKDAGVNLSSLIPLGGSALTISVNLLKTGGLGGHHHEEPSASQEEEPKDLGVLGRVSIFQPLGDFTFLEAGLSFLRAEFDTEENRFADLGNVDFKLKWRPDQYRALTLVGEALVNSRAVDNPEDEGTSSVRSWGAFAALEFRFLKRWDTGAFYDFTQHAEDEHENLRGFGTFAGFSLAEETTRFGILLRRDEGSQLSDPYHTAMLQILWSLGPHKPHPF